jgi:ribosomal protein S18 acetylase RimI-like enzyme
MIDIRTIVPSQEPIADTTAVLTQLLEQGAGKPAMESEITAYVGRWAEVEQARMLIAEEDGSPIGWLGVAPWPGEYASLHWLRGSPVGWPSVVSSADVEDVGRSLLAAAVDIVPDEVAALIMSIDHDIEIDEERLALLQSRYAAIGYQYSEAVHFVHPTDGVTAPDVPDSLVVRPLREADPEQLTSCIRDIFSGEYSGIFCGGLPEEQETFLRGLPESETMQEAASVVLLADDEIVGFSSVHGVRENENLLVNWIGIRPAWRRRGYASFLLRHILSVAAEEGYATASLSSEVRNQASLALYEGQGWEIEGGEKQFAKYLCSAPEEEPSA